MSSIAWRLCFAASIAEVVCVAGQVADPIRERLDTAILQYQASMVTLEEDVLKELDRLETAARKAKRLDRARIERITAERLAFVDLGDIPPDVSRKNREKIASARDAIQRDFRAAADEYIRAREDEKSRQLERELRVLLKLARPEEANATSIFNEKDLAGWQFQNGNGSYVVDRGHLICQASGGRLETLKEFTDFSLKLEYWIPPDAERRDHGTGILLMGGGKVIGLDGKGAIEYQIKSGDSGTLWVLAGQGEENPHRPRKEAAEHPAGLWNEVEIRCKGPDLTFFLNKQIVNEARLDFPVPSRLALRAGTVGVRFRNVRVISPTAP